MAKHQTVAKKIRRLGDEAMQNRLNSMKKLKTYWENQIKERGIDDVLKEVRLQKGNDKTGVNCWTISFIPILDCVNCSGCMYDCYDLRNDCWMDNVQNDRARNSACHDADPEKFWKRVSELVKELFVEQLRLNVGGDLKNNDFALINEYLAKPNSKTDILFFTKNYDGLNAFLDENEFEPNVKDIMSAWKGMKMENPHNVPCSHVLYADGSTTAPEFGSYYCGGNCSECHFKDEGCWKLQKGESVIFLAH